MQGSVRTRRTGSAEVPPAAPGSASAMLGGGTVLRAADVDVGQARERRRQRRLVRLAVVLWVAAQPAGATRRAGRSGPGRVGSPLEVT